jgi:LacI family transcriptional regulator
MVPVDFLNIRLLEACYELDLHVPGDIALLGVGDEPVCTEMEIGFSSVRPGHDQLGRTAADMLLRMREGQEVPPEVTLVPPDGISVRRSSGREPREDPVVARALDYLRGTAVEDIDFDELWEQLPASHRTVQRRFKAALGHSIRQEVRRLRVRKACDLLETTDLSLADVAVRTGYEHISSLCRAFKEETGVTPTGYREGKRPSETTG